MELMKHVVRYAVIAGLVGGAAVAIAGPERVGALFDQTRGKINQAIDAHIEDPVALRSQMRQLEGEYPARIAEVRGDLAELQQQVSQLNRELEVSHRVVDLAAADLDQMQTMLTRAEVAQTSASGNQVVKVVFANESLELKDAYGKANRIRQVHTAYTSRATDIERDLGYLAQQESRLTTLLNQLETEHAEFQAQLWQMDRQVDSIARNDRLINMMEKRQRTIDEQSRYGAHSLDQLSGRFADIRAKQEAKLEALGSGTTTLNYEDRAKFDIDAEKSTIAPTRSRLTAPKAKPSVIEIRPDDSLHTPDSTVQESQPLALDSNR
jgi:predicted RNase H-like nuclease (RuvC/YqgF family)